MASNFYEEVVLTHPFPSIQVISYENNSSTSSSIVMANIETLKNNLKEMMSNLSEMGHFLDKDDINKKQTATSIQHSMDVCDASKSDEMKLNEILDLLHHLTNTLTTYEKSPLLAEYACWKDANLKMKTDPAVETCLSNWSGEREEEQAQHNCLNENKSLRNEIDGIIQRKEALDEKMQSFRKASTAVAPAAESDCSFSKNHIKSSPISCLGASSSCIISPNQRSYGCLDDLKKEDELLGLSDDGGLSGEIHSLGQTIQHLLDENRNFRSFFNTILAKEKSDISTDNVSLCEDNNCISQIATIEKEKFPQRSHVAHNYINYDNDKMPNLQVTKRGSCQQKRVSVSKSHETKKAPPNERSADNNNVPVSNLKSSHQNKVSSIIDNCDLELMEDSNQSNSLLVSKTSSAPDTYLSKKSRNSIDVQVDSIGECDSRQSIGRIVKNSSQYNKLNRGGKLPYHMVQLCETECKLNNLMKVAQAFKGLLKIEKSNLASNDSMEYIDTGNASKFCNIADNLNNICNEICSNVAQLFQTRNKQPCTDEVCNYEIGQLKKQNKLLQKQLSLQMGLTALIASPSSKLSELPQSQCASIASASMKLNEVPQSQNARIANCAQWSPNSILQSEKFVLESNHNNGSLCVSQIKNTAQSSPETANELHNEKVNQLHKLVAEERLRGQLWFAAEKATAIRLDDVQQRLRKAKQSKRELQVKYMSVKQSSESRKCLSANSKKVYPLKSYEIMLTTLGQNIGIAADIISSHLYYSKCGIHPSPELHQDPTFWFAAQCSRLRWLQAELRQLCIGNWKSTAQATEYGGEDETDILTSEMEKKSCPVRPTSHNWQATSATRPQRRLSLPEYGEVASPFLFPYGSCSHLSDDKGTLHPSGDDMPFNNVEVINFIQELTHTSGTIVDSTESQVCNSSTFEGISDISAGPIHQFINHKHN